MSDMRKQILSERGNSPEGDAVVEAAVALIQETTLTYGAGGAGGEFVTPIPTCVGCNQSGWGEIVHYPDCRARELIDAVKKLLRTRG